MQREFEALHFEAATQADAREGDQQRAEFAKMMPPYLLVLGAKGVPTTSTVQIVLRVRYRGFWRRFKRQSL
jgi:hypothetical protein